MCLLGLVALNFARVQSSRLASPERRRKIRHFKNLQTFFVRGFALAIAFTVPTPTALLERAFDTLIEMFSVGAGAIFGLLGGKCLEAV
jgi:hypothetical protein